ncbi:MAG: DUF2950 domain-containing protein [Planctomycetota bacterium]
MKTIGRFSLVLVLGACSSRSGAQFETPDEASRQLVAALRADNIVEVEVILGPESQEILDSGDPVADRNGRQEFVRLYDEKHRLEPVDDRKVTLCIGEIDWPVPVPIVKSGDIWVFDTAAGREEVFNRRIGKNELNAIQVCLAYCDTQREYYAQDRDGDGILEYAQKFKSSPGKQDGLYWPAKEGEPQSPLGEFAAKAVKEGYGGAKEGEGPQPYHGYYYRILKAQGANAPGAAQDYVVKGHMIGGFALVAYPSEYGNSGVMTFVVSYEGKVHQKDLGEDTPKAAEAMTGFDPDASWAVVLD